MSIKQKQILFAFTIFLLLCGSAIAATPLVPEGGTGYTVSGQIEGGDISYTINTLGDSEYELTHDIITTASYGILFQYNGDISGIKTIIGNGFTIESANSGIYWNSNSIITKIGMTNQLNISNIKYVNILSNSPQNGYSANSNSNANSGSKFNLTINNSSVGEVRIYSGNGGNGYYVPGTYPTVKGAASGGNIIVTILNQSIEEINVVPGSGGSMSQMNAGNAGKGGSIDINISDSIVNTSIILKSGNAGGTGAEPNSGGNIVVNLYNSTFQDITLTGGSPTGNRVYATSGSTIQFKSNSSIIGNMHFTGGQGVGGNPRGLVSGEIINNNLSRISFISEPNNITYYANPQQGNNVMGGSYIAGNFWRNVYYLNGTYSQSFLKNNSYYDFSNFPDLAINGDIYPLVDPSKIPDVSYKKHLRQ